ncbi:serine proteinase [Crepidotus variabilis]|uniref:Serine proteinase n=1 Tax=Crepidotus variabilis TaxID=179855 RepID=A0A9P6E4Y5_9AGAR|nr:serine proteinase [Crepidotus variabilis]
MHFFATSITLAALAASAIAAATPLRTIQTYQGENSGRHIITLKQGASKDGVLSKARLSSNVITHDWDIINGFAGKFNDDILNALRSDPEVESVTEDGIMHIVGTQTDAPWGLGRISTTPKLASQDVTALTYNYAYADDKLGSGVDIFIVDTGIRTTHVTFGGRARWGATFGGYASVDGHGHGTHCAGTAVGAQYGVSKNANVIAVKVLSDGGSGTVADIVSGLQYVKDQAAASGHPSIVSMSLGGGASQPLDDAVASLTTAGVHVAVAAGNSNTDAGTTSPARAPSAVTVGASTIADARASFSNYGPVVDIFAPGQDVISAWNTNDTATNRISGTSMATPHIAGLIAYVVARDGNDTPAAISAKLQNQALKGIITGIPSGTVNYLAHND